MVPAAHTVSQSAEPGAPAPRPAPRVETPSLGDPFAALLAMFAFRPAPESPPDFDNRPTADDDFADVAAMDVAPDDEAARAATRDPARPAPGDAQAAVAGRETIDDDATAPEAPLASDVADVRAPVSVGAPRRLTARADAPAGQATPTASAAAAQNVLKPSPAAGTQATAPAGVSVVAEPPSLASRPTSTLSAATAAVAESGAAATDPAQPAKLVAAARDIPAGPPATSDPATAAAGKAAAEATAPSRAVPGGSAVPGGTTPADAAAPTSPPSAATSTAAAAAPTSSVPAGTATADAAAPPSTPSAATSTAAASAPAAAPAPTAPAGKGGASAAVAAANSDATAASPGATRTLVAPGEPAVAPSVARPGDALALRSQPGREGAAARAPAIEQIALSIRRAAAAGRDRLQIRLDPPELGRIEVRLELGRDHRLKAEIVVERPETLDLLQRDARQLQRALHDVGVEAETSDLNFSLGGGNHAAPGEERPQRAQAAPAGVASESEPDPEPIWGGIVAADRVDLRV